MIYARYRMFKHKHYVPILKGKRAEFPALRDLKNTKSVTPLIETIPTGDVDAVPKQMEASGWNKKHPYFLDMLFFDDGSSGKPRASVVSAMKAASKLSHLAIPVTG